MKPAFKFFSQSLPPLAPFISGQQTWSDLRQRGLTQSRSQPAAATLSGCSTKACRPSRLHETEGIPLDGSCVPARLDSATEPYKVGSGGQRMEITANRCLCSYSGLSGFSAVRTKLRRYKEVSSGQRLLHDASPCTVSEYSQPIYH